jgi:hypothetical protein
MGRKVAHFAVNGTDFCFLALGKSSLERVRKAEERLILPLSLCLYQAEHNRSAFYYGN